MTVLVQGFMTLSLCPGCDPFCLVLGFTDYTFDHVVILISLFHDVCDCLRKTQAKNKL